MLAKAEKGELQIEEDGKLRLRRINKSAIVAIRLLIFTGARKSEILGLRWEWIDMEAGHASLPESKTGKKRILMPPAALDVLKGLDKPQGGRGYVIRGGDLSDPEIPLVNIKGPWGVVRIAAGLPDVRPHDLRHSYAAAMAAGGMSLLMIGELLGHRNSATTQRYAHLAHDPLKAKADQIGSTLAEHLNAGEGGAESVPLCRK